MSRTIATAITVLALAGCKSDKKSEAQGGASATSRGSTAPGGSTALAGAKASAVAQAASQLKDPCAVMPTELVKKHIPDAAAPAKGVYPTECSMGNGKSVVELKLSGGFGEPDPPQPSQVVTDLGQKAWLQEQQADDAYLVIFLGKDDQGSFRALFLEYAGHDGKNHKDDAIEIARGIIAALHS